MKTKLTTLCMIVLLGLVSFNKAEAQLKLIHYWDFNNTLPAGGAGGINLSPLPADWSILGNANLTFDNSTTTAASCGCAVRDSIMDNGSGGTGINARAVLGDDTAGSSANNLYIRLRNPSHNMRFLWYIPTTHYDNILLTFATETSSATSGQKYLIYSYSLDSGITFQTTALPLDTTPMATLVNYSKVQLNLNAISGANNNPKFVFCITFGDKYENDTIKKGNTRFDNITVEGDTILAPISVSTVTGSTNLCPNTTTALTAQSSVDNPKYTWYHQAVGGAALFTGNPYTTSAIAGMDSLFVEVQDSAIVGDSASSRFKVVITAIDTTKPTISGMPSNMTVYAGSSSCSAIANWINPTATDNCSAVNFSSNDSSGHVFPIGVTNVVYTAVDSSGNTRMASFKVTVKDTIKPLISGCPADIEGCDSLVTFTSPTATDNCSSSVTPVLTSGMASGSIFPIGVTTEVFTATDSSGNSATCSFTITVDNCLSVSQYNNGINFNVYPNPSDGDVTVSITNTKNHPVLNFYNVLGQQIQSVELKKSETTIPQGTLQSGIYFYRLMNDNGILKTGKLVIQK